MLQRQIMFKQLQELQRRQQLQELGNNRNQNYVHQLPSLKQASGGQFSPTISETPEQDSSQMFTFGNMQMMQHNGSSGLVLSQNHNLVPKFGVSSYGVHAPNADEYLNQYSNLQGPSNLPANLLTKNQSTSDSSCMSQRYNFSSNQISMPDGSLLSNQENIFFGQVRAEGFNSGVLSGNYPQQGFTMQKNASFLESEKMDENAGSLDPLEQKILYNTDDNSWESAFSRISKMNSGGFGKKVDMPSIQIGSWSALMQSAVAESPSSDAGVQEEWSGLSFQNPEPLNDGEKLQNDWVDRNLQNASSPSSKPHDTVQNMNSFTSFQQSAQHLKQKEEYQPTGGSQLIQESLPSPNIWSGEHKELSNNDAHQPGNFSCTNDNQSCINFSGHEFRGTFWPQGSTSDHMSGIPKNYNQVNELNNHGYSIEPENMAPVGVSNGENVTAPSGSMFELLNKDDTPNDQTSAIQSSSKVSIPRNLPNTSPVSPDFRFGQRPTDPQISQSYSSFPDPSVSNRTTTQFPAYSGAPPQDYSELKHSNSSGLEFPLLENLSESQPSLTPDMLQHARFPMGLSTPWPENQNSIQHDYQQLEKGNFLRDGSTEMNNYTSISRNTHEQKFTRKHHLETNPVESGPSITNPQEQAANQAEVKKEPPSFPASDIGSFRHSSNQNYSSLHQVLSTRNDETDGVENFPPKIENVSNQHSIVNARKLLLSGLQSRVKDRAKSDSYAVSQFGAFLSGNISAMSYNQNSQNNNPNRSTNSNDTSNLAYQSHISSQMAPSWFKHYEMLKNGFVLPINAEQPFAEMTLEKLQENSLIMQANLESGVWPSTAATSIASKQLNTACVLPLNVTYQNLAVSIPKKRKLAALDMVPWHKEGNYEQSRLQDISTAEYLWAETLNRKPKEANNVAEIVEEMLLVTRAKRRLISTAQLMQQVFRPAPVFILCSDARPNGDCVAYFAARLALGDAWSLTGQLASDTTNMSPDELKTSKRTKAYKFSEVVEGFINRVKKVEPGLSRLDKSLSFVDIKVEARELEKFSTINRFAKFHVRAHPVSVDPVSSSGTTTLRKPNPQRYVVPHPMPKIVPEKQNCLSL